MQVSFILVIFWHSYYWCVQLFLFYLLNKCNWLRGGYLLKSSRYAILLFFYSMLYCKYLRNDRSRPRNRSGFVVEEIHRKYPSDVKILFQAKSGVTVRSLWCHRSLIWCNRIVQRLENLEIYQRIFLNFKERGSMNKCKQ